MRPILVAATHALPRHDPSRAPLEVRQGAVLALSVVDDDSVTRGDRARIWQRLVGFSVDETGAGLVGHVVARQHDDTVGRCEHGLTPAEVVLVPSALVPRDAEGGAERHDVVGVLLAPAARVRLVGIVARHDHEPSLDRADEFGLRLVPLQRDLEPGRQGSAATGEREAIAHAVDVQRDRHREMVLKIERLGERNPWRLESNAAHALQGPARKLHGLHGLAPGQELDPRLDRLDQWIALVLEHHKEDEGLGRPGLDDAIVVDEHASRDGAQPDVRAGREAGMSWRGAEHRAQEHARLQGDDTGPLHVTSASHPATVPAQRSKPGQISSRRLRRSAAVAYFTSAVRPVFRSAVRNCNPDVLYTSATLRWNIA